MIALLIFLSCTISGTIYDVAGPLADAYAVAYSDGSVIVSNWTGKDGRYTLEAPRCDVPMMAFALNHVPAGRIPGTNDFFLYPQVPSPFMVWGFIYDVWSGEPVDATVKLAPCAGIAAPTLISNTDEDGQFIFYVSTEWLEMLEDSNCAMFTATSDAHISYWEEFLLDDLMAGEGIYINLLPYYTTHFPFTAR